MADVVHPVHGEVHRHPAPTGFIRKYVFSTDHKVIGIQYWSLALFSVFVGMALSLLMRLQLGWPGQEWGFLKTLFPSAAENGTISGEFYLSLLTMHVSDKRATAFAKCICSGRNQKALVHGGPEAYNS